MSDLTLQRRLAAAGFYPESDIDGVWGPKTSAAVDLVIELAKRSRDGVNASAVAVTSSPLVKPVQLLERDFVDAAAQLDGDVAKIKAVKVVESGGAWFQDVRQSILDLDGPGGFLSGPDLPKILFEAHLFSRETRSRFDRSHPAISAPAWDRSLYIGGQGEYERLYQAMLLDHDAALRSTSWGMFQILGANHKAAGFADVRSYVEAMKRGEREHLLAFVAFIRNTPGLLAKYRKIGPTPKACVPFCAAYNGPGYLKNAYHTKLAAAYQRAAA